MSRWLVKGTAKKLDESLGRDLYDLDVVAIMIDGVIFAQRAIVAALLVTVEAVEVLAGIVHGDTDTATVVAALLQGLLDRGLDIDGGPTPSEWSSSTQDQSARLPNKLETGQVFCESGYTGPARSL